MEVGFDNSDPTYTFRVCNANGEIIGIRKRSARDLRQKWYVTDSKAGLFIPEGVTSGNVQIASESESDLAAALTLGFAAIGMPGAKMDGAGSMAVEFIARCAVPCPCIVFDNDDTGPAGAEKQAQRFLEAGIPCRVLVPPEIAHGREVEDLRDWLLSGLTPQELSEAIEAAKIRRPVGWAGGFEQVPHAAMRAILERLQTLAERHRASNRDKFSASQALAQLWAILGYAGKGKVARVSREQLAADLRYKNCRSVELNNKALKEIGVLTWLRGRTKRVNEYRVNVGPILGSRGNPYRVRPAFQDRKKKV